jgi:GNAT superfamily N-acetyltransferase
MTTPTIPATTLTDSAASSRLQFRSLEATDQDQLWHWLHLSLWDPPPAPLRPPEVLHHPGVRIYAEQWGRPGDLGRVVVIDGRDIGACWMRLMPDGVGLGFVDSATPQLGIALEPAFQHRGHGAVLMRATLAAAWRAGNAQVALTVHPQNSARRVYQRCGFVEAGLRGSYHLMVARRPAD